MRKKSKNTRCQFTAQKVRLPQSVCQKLCDSWLHAGEAIPRCSIFRRGLVGNQSERLCGMRWRYYFRELLCLELTKPCPTMDWPPGRWAERNLCWWFGWVNSNGMADLAIAICSATNMVARFIWMLGQVLSRESIPKKSTTSLSTNVDQSGIEVLSKEQKCLD